MEVVAMWMEVGSKRNVWGHAAVGGLCLALWLSTATSPVVAQSDPGTIVFELDGALWRMPGDDPSRAVQLSDPDEYRSAAQAPDGAMVTVFDDDLTVWPLDRALAPVADPFRPFPLEGFIFDLDVSSTGEVFAYSGAAPCQPGGFQFCRFANLAYVDGRDSSEVELFRAGAEGMSFYAPDRIVWEEGNQLLLHQIGRDTVDVWLPSCGEFGLCSSVEISPDGRYVAGTGTGTVNIVEMTGPPPAPLGTQTCSLTTSLEGEIVLGVSWSPDGTSLLFTGAGSADEPEVESGIWQASGIGTSSCAEIQDGLEVIVRDGGAPDWGPANFEELQSLLDGPPPIDLTAGGRLVGGGTTDPVGQTIATSQFLFPDGTAERVVLATADRFPDALAGAALAGGSAPILLTSGLGELDRRIEAEILRVTGGSGTVLTLGGTAAVSEQAAAQARAAAGDQVCTAPVPTTCRYAGTGREDTAALIGRTVIAEHPGTSALLARGDEFADAITGGAYAAAARVPVLLTPPDSLNQQTETFIAEAGITDVVVLGGTAAVDDATVEAIPDVQTRRVAGAERTETAADIATQLWGTGDGPDARGVVLVNVRDSNGWQTALSAAVVSARTAAPQLGVENPPTGLSSATTEAIQAIGAPVMAFGDEALVSVDQLRSATAAAS